MKSVKQTKAIGYFDQLAKSTQELVRKLILDAAKERGGPDAYKLDEECVKIVECYSRDGFIPFDSNRGGITYQNFTDLMGYFGGGYSVSHKKANAEIQRQIAHGLECALENFQQDFVEELKGIPLDKQNYHDLYELKQGSLAECLSEYENENLQGDENSIMHELRFLYHGAVSGVHSASVSASVNTEGPYHRSHISWAPHVFCEGAKEVKIIWRTQAELKKKLKAALAKVSKAVF